MVKMLQALGMILLIFGSLAWVETLLENMVTFENPDPKPGGTVPIRQTWGFDFIIGMVIDGVIVAVGAVIFVWSTKSGK